MKHNKCNDCLNVFKHPGKCKVCGSKDVTPIIIKIQKQTLREY
jgi:RNA polymerase subunit RPABC4/transcription elongation factor Spt4